VAIVATNDVLRKADLPSQKRDSDSDDDDDSDDSDDDDGASREFLELDAKTTTTHLPPRRPSIIATPGGGSAVKAEAASLVSRTATRQRAIE
jgi:hypothetical protein